MHHGGEEGAGTARQTPISHPAPLLLPDCGKVQILAPFSPESA